jgi:hypothetical protein
MGQTGLRRALAANGGRLSTAEVSAAVDRGRLFQAYSKAHPRALLSAARFLKPEPHIWRANRDSRADVCGERARWAFF